MGSSWPTLGPICTASKTEKWLYDGPDGPNHEFNGACAPVRPPTLGGFHPSEWSKQHTWTWLSVPGHLFSPVLRLFGTLCARQNGSKLGPRETKIDWKGFLPKVIPNHLVRLGLGFIWHTVSHFAPVWDQRTKGPKDQRRLGSPS